jgi:hypothetical protein
MRSVLVWLGYIAVGAWIAVGYLALISMCFGATQSLMNSLGGYPISFQIAGNLLPVWVWGYPVLVQLVNLARKTN